MTYTTPDDSHETPQGTPMDISRVIVGLQPTFQTLSDASFNESKQKMSTRFVGYILRATDLATAKNVVLNMQDTVDKSVSTITEGAPVYMSENSINDMKSELEKFRIPLMENMFAFDDPKLFASLKAASPSPSTSPSASPSTSPSTSPGASGKEGFSTLIPSDVGGWMFCLGGGAALALAVVLIWALTCGKSYRTWYRSSKSRSKTRRRL